MQTDAPPAVADDVDEHPADAEELLRPGEAASILGISIATLGRYARDGVVPSRALPSGHKRYVRSVIEAISAGTYVAPDASENPDAATRPADDAHAA